MEKRQRVKWGVKPEEIGQLRQELGLSANEFARIIGASPLSLWRWGKGGNEGQEKDFVAPVKPDVKRAIELIIEGVRLGWNRMALAAILRDPYQSILLASNQLKKDLECSLNDLKSGNSKKLVAYLNAYGRTTCMEFSVFAYKGRDVSQLYNTLVHFEKDERSLVLIGPDILLKMVEWLMPENTQEIKSEDEENKEE